MLGHLAHKLFGLSKFVECGELSNMGHASWSFGRLNTISDSKFRFELKNLTFDMGKAEHGFGNDFKHDFQPKLVRICSHYLNLIYTIPLCFVSFSIQIDNIVRGCLEKSFPYYFERV